MDIFTTCKTISNYFNNNKEYEARKELFFLLDYLEKNKEQYTPLVNHLIRKSGLYLYMEPKHSDWSDQLVYEMFKSNVGLPEPMTLHREQSSILKKLLNSENIAVSAPTSFGKSFIIDAFISIKKPNNVVIIVPTIALTDETRRRINKKFASQYKIITQADINLAEKNIFIFPQERALNYVETIESIDILIIDEFYKASLDFDKERAPSLLEVINKFSKKAQQKYFLAPNITSLKDNIFPDKIDFIKIDFNTVYTKVEECYGNKNEKEKKLLDILIKNKGTKSLVYVGGYKAIGKLTKLFVEKYRKNESKLITDFSNWLKINYGADYPLSELVQRGVGIHNGQLHRSIAQIQVKLFEEDSGLNIFLTTSSIIEGVNTSAENIILWSNKNGRSIMDIFTYKNIIGRGGRMFKHFIGKVFLLERPPPEENTQLSLDFDAERMSHLEELQNEEFLTSEQKNKVKKYWDEMYFILGEEAYEKFKNKNLLLSTNSEFIKKIAREIRDNKTKWRALSFLNNDNISGWDSGLYLCLEIMGKTRIEYNKFVSFIKTLSQNWKSDLPVLIEQLKKFGIELEKYFELEREVAFNFTAVVKDISALYNLIHQEDRPIDTSRFTSKSSNAFLPKLVYQLEEYGLPRMLTKKIHLSKLIDVEKDDKPINELIKEFIAIGKEAIKSKTNNLHPFDSYIIDYFYEGIISNDKG